MPISTPVPEEYARPFDAKSLSTYDQYVAFSGPYMIANDAKGKSRAARPASASSCGATPTGRRTPTTVRPTSTGSSSRRATRTPPWPAGGSSTGPASAGRRRSGPAPCPQAGGRALQGAGRARAQRRLPHRLAEHDRQAVRRPQRAQGGAGRLRPRGHAPCRAAASSWATSPRTTSRRASPRSEEAGGERGPGADFPAKPGATWRWPRPT